MPRTYPGSGPVVAQNYAVKRKEQNAQMLRERIIAANYLTDIHKDITRNIPDAELPQVKFKTETRLKLLAKVLPDLKAVEMMVSEVDGNSPLKLSMLQQLRGLSAEELELLISITEKTVLVEGVEVVEAKDVRAADDGAE